MSDEKTTNPAPMTMVEVVDIQFRPGQKVYYFDPAGLICKQGDHVIIDTARGPEYGICTSGNHRIAQSDVVAPLRPVIRHATAHDKRIAAENQEKEAQAFEVCMKKIQEHELDMQLVSAECAFDGTKLLFFFTADERVDFRELVKDLAGSFHTRIELRQIGVRDKAKMVGGLGICGRPFCCASFLDDFQPVSIKMAKTQNLSLNPTKISGTCGRLMCCLKYEQDAYEDLIKNSPKADSFVDTPEGRGTIVEVELLRQRVKVKMENQPEVINTFLNSEIAVLRSGKAKKTDPPIPADLAPISGAAKRQKPAETKDGPVFLDPIRFRYSTETVVEEPEAAEAAPEASEAESQEQKKQGRRRNRKPKNPEKPAENPQEAVQPEQQPKAPKQPKPEAQKKPAKQETQPKQPKQEAPKQPEAKQQEKPQAVPEAEGQDAAKKKPHRRRPNHRHHKPKQPGEGAAE